MAISVSQELKNFKAATFGKEDGLKASLSLLTDSLETLSNAIATAQSGISSYYNSANKEVIISSISKLSETCKKIEDSVNTDLGGMIAEVSSLNKDIEQLEKYVTAVENASSVIYSENQKDEPDSRVIANANATINDSTEKFNTLNESVVQKLASLKNNDANLQFVSDFSVSSFEASLGDLQYGSFTTQTFTSSNGIKIKYYLYVPDYGKEVDGLPVMLYMHGVGMDNTGEGIVTYGGLGEVLQNKTVTPSGIIAIPYVKNGHLYEDEEYRKALAELPLQVCEDYNGDRNRISCGGVSYGSVTAYRLVNENPGEFSCVVAACGAEEVTSAFNGVKVWNFNGKSNSSGHTGTKYVEGQTEEVKKVGGTALEYTVFDTYAHTNVGTMTFQNKHPDETGTEIYPFEWAFKQVNESTRKKASSD